MTGTGGSDRTPDAHVLPPELHDAYRREHAEAALSATTASSQPTLIIIAGQPGAGKSLLAGAALRGFEGEGGAVLVDIDELRTSHPGYAALQQGDDRRAAGRVQDDAGRWGDELLEDARMGRRNIVLDGTLKSPDKAEALCRHFRAQGYRIELRAMATPAEESRLAIYRRYENMKAKGRPGRWVPADVHDPAFNGVSASMRRLDAGGLVDRIEVHGRPDGASTATREIYAGPAGTGRAADAFDEERSRRRTAPEQARQQSEWQAVAELVTARDPHLHEIENCNFMAAYRQREIAPSAPADRGTTMQQRFADAGRSKIKEPPGKAR